MRRLGRILFDAARRGAVAPFRTSPRRWATGAALCAVTIGLWVVSVRRNDFLGWHRLSVEDGRVVERWSGVSSGDGRITLGSTTYSTLGPVYLRYHGADPKPISHFGCVRLGKAIPFGEWDENFIVGFGLVTGGSAHGPSKAPRPRGQVPVFDFESDRAFVAVPWWFVLVTLVSVAAWRFNGFLDRRRAALIRRSVNRCPVCDYDCRATPERCPECGTDLDDTAAGSGEASPRPVAALPPEGK